MNIVHKIFKFDGGKILTGPKKGEKFGDAWGWISFQAGINDYSMLHYTYDKKVVQQFTNSDLFKSTNSSVANIREVPNKFLYEIIKWEFRG